jgi:anti-anti-sigma regulatory factor
MLSCLYKSEPGERNMSLACKTTSYDFTRTIRFSLPIYVLSNQLDFTTCQALLQALQGDIDADCRAIAVDLSQVAELEPSAAWLLVTVQQFMRQRHRRFLLLDPRPGVGAVLARAWMAVSGLECKN